MATRKYEVKVSSVGLKEVIGEFKDLNSQMKATTSTANKLPASMQQIIRSSRSAAMALEALNKQIEALNRKTVSIKVDMTAATAALKKVISVDAKVKNIILPTKKTVIEAEAKVSNIKMPKALKNLEVTASVTKLDTRAIDKTLDFKGRISKLDLVDKKAPLAIKNATIQKVKLAEDIKGIKVTAEITNTIALRKQLENMFSDVGVNVRVNTKQAPQLAQRQTNMSKPNVSQYMQANALHNMLGDAESYKNLQGIAQASSSATRNFSKMNAEFSPLVATYAKLAANVFALSAAYETLNKAINFGNLIRGSQELGSQVGVDMGRITKAVSEATRGMVALPDIMRLSNMAVSQGLDLDKFVKLSGLTTKVSQAFGRDATDSLNRVVLGVSKLETEFLDELGIMVRADDLTQKYAKSLGKTKDEITQSTKSQLLLNEALRQLEEKFGAVQLPVNQLEVFSTKMQEVLYNAGSWITSTDSIFNKFLEGLNANPFAIWTVGILAFSKVLKSLVPSLDQVAERQEQLSKQRAAIESIKRQKASQSRALELAGKAGSSSEIGELANLLNMMEKSKSMEGVALAKSFKESLFSGNKVSKELVDKLHLDIIEAITSKGKSNKIDVFGNMLDIDVADKIAMQLENLDNKIAIFATKNAKNTSKIKSAWTSAMSSIAGAKSAFTFGLQGERQQYDEQGNLVDISKFSMDKTRTQAIDRMLSQRNEDIALAMANRSASSIRDLKKGIETNTKGLAETFADAISSIVDPASSKAFLQNTMQKSTAEQLRIIDSEYKTYESRILNEIRMLEAKKRALAEKVKSLTSAGYKGAALPYQMQMLDVNTRLENERAKERELIPTKAFVKNKMGGSVSDDIETLNKIDPILAKMDKGPGVFTRLSAGAEALTGGLGRVIGAFAILGSKIGWIVLAFEGLRALTKWAASSSIPVMQKLGNAVLGVADAFIKWAESKDLIDTAAETKIKEKLEAAAKASEDFNATIKGSVEKINAIPSEKRIDLIVQFEEGLESNLTKRIEALVPALGDSLDAQFKKIVTKKGGGMRPVREEISYELDPASSLGKLQEDVKGALSNAAAVGDFNALTYLQELQKKLNELNRDSNTNDVAKMLWDWQDQLSSSVKSSAELTKNISGLSKELSTGLADYSSMLQKLDTYTDKQGRKTLKGDNSAQINDLMAQMGESMGKNLKIVDELSASVLNLNNSKALDGLASSSETVSAKLADTRTQLQEISAKDHSVNLTAEIAGIEAAKQAIDSVVEYAKAKSAFIEIAVAMNLGDIAKAEALNKKYMAEKQAGTMLKQATGERIDMSPTKENLKLLEQREAMKGYAPTADVTRLQTVVSAINTAKAYKGNISGVAPVKEPKGKKDSGGGALDNAAYYEREQLLIRLKALQEAYTSSFVDYYKVGKQIAMLEAEDLDRKIKKDGSTQTEINSMKESKTVTEAKSKSIRFLAQDEKILEGVLRNTTDAIQAMSSAFSDGLGSLEDYMTALSLAFGDRMLSRMQLLKQQGLDTVKALSLALGEAANLMAKSKPEAALTQDEAYIRSSQENVAAVRGNDLRKQLDDLRYESKLAELTDKQLEMQGGKEAAILQLRIEDLAVQKQALQTKYDFSTLVEEEAKYAELVAAGREKEARALLEGNGSLLAKIQAQETLKSLDSQLINNSETLLRLEKLRAIQTQNRIKALRKEENEARGLIKYSGLGSEKAKAMVELDTYKDPQEKQAFIDTKLAQEEADFLIKKADEVQARYEDLANRIGDGFSQAFKESAESGKLSFKDLFDQLKEWFFQLMADFAKKELFGPLLNSLTGINMNSKGPFSSLLGADTNTSSIFAGFNKLISGDFKVEATNPLSFLTGGSSSGVNSSAISDITSSLGSISNTSQLSSNISSIAQGLGVIGSLGKGFLGSSGALAGGQVGGALTGGSATNTISNFLTPSFASTGTSGTSGTTGAAGSGMLGGISSALTNIGAGMAGGMAGNFVSSSLGLKDRKEGAMGGMVGSTVFAAMAAVLLSSLGPLGIFLGAFLGDIIGSALGSLFADDPKKAIFKFKAVKSDLTKKLDSAVKTDVKVKVGTRTPFGDIFASIYDPEQFLGSNFKAIKDSFEASLYLLKDSDTRLANIMMLREDELAKINDRLYSGTYDSKLNRTTEVLEPVTADMEDPMKTIDTALKTGMKARQKAVYQSIVKAFDMGDITSSILREGQIEWLRKAFDSGKKKINSSIESMLNAVGLLSTVASDMAAMPAAIMDTLTKLNLKKEISQLKAAVISGADYSLINEELLGGASGYGDIAPTLKTAIQNIMDTPKSKKDTLELQGKELETLMRVGSDVSTKSGLGNFIVKSLGAAVKGSDITTVFEKVTDVLKMSSLAGETLTETYARLTDIIEKVTPAISSLGINIADFGKEFTYVISQLTKEAGGADNIAALLETATSNLNPNIVAANVTEFLSAAVTDSTNKLSSLLKKYDLTKTLFPQGLDNVSNQELITKALSPDVLKPGYEAVSVAMLEVVSAQTKYIEKLKETKNPLYALYVQLNNLVDVIMENGDLIDSLASNYKSVVSGAKKLDIEGSTKGVSSALEKALTLAAPDLKDGFMSTFDTIFSDLDKLRTSSGLKGFINFMDQLFNSRSGAISTSPNIDTDSIEYLQRVLEALAGAALEAKDSLKDYSKFMFKETSISDFESKLGDMFGNLYSTIQSIAASGAEDAMGKIRAVQRNFANAVVYAFSQLISSIKRTYGQAMSSFGDTAYRTIGIKSTGMAAGRITDLLTKFSYTAELLNDSTMSTNDKLSILGDLVSINEDIYAVATDQLNLLMDIARYSEELALNSRSPYTTYEKFLKGKSKYEETLSAAKAGDTEAIKALPDISDQYLELAGNFYTSSKTYKKIFEGVSSDINKILRAGTGNFGEEEQTKPTEIIKMAQAAVDLAFLNRVGLLGFSSGSSDGSTSGEGLADAISELASSMPTISSVDVMKKAAELMAEELGRATMDVAYVLKGSGISKEDFEEILGNYSEELGGILSPLAGANLDTLTSVEDVLTRLEQAINGEIQAVIPDATMKALGMLISETLFAAYPVGYAQALVDFITNKYPGLMNALDSFVGDNSPFALAIAGFVGIFGSNGTFTTSIANLLKLDFKTPISEGIQTGLSGITTAMGTLSTSINNLKTAIDNISIDVTIPEIKVTVDVPTTTTTTTPTTPIIQYQPSPEIPKEWYDLYNNLPGLGNLTGNQPLEPVNLQNNLLIGQDLGGKGTSLGTTPETTTLGTETVSFGDAESLLTSFLKNTLYKDNLTFEGFLGKQGIGLQTAVSSMLAGVDWSELFSGKQVSKNTKFDSKFQALLNSFKNMDVTIGGANIESSQLGSEFKDKTTFTENKLASLDFTGAAASVLSKGGLPTGIGVDLMGGGKSSVTAQDLASTAKSYFAGRTVTELTQSNISELATKLAQDKGLKFNKSGRTRNQGKIETAFGKMFKDLKVSGIYSDAIASLSGSDTDIEAATYTKEMLDGMGIESRISSLMPKAGYIKTKGKQKIYPANIYSAIVNTLEGKPILGTSLSSLDTESILSNIRSQFSISADKFTGRDALLKVLNNLYTTQPLNIGSDISTMADQAESYIDEVAIPSTIATNTAVGTMRGTDTSELSAKSTALLRLDTELSKTIIANPKLSDREGILWSPTTAAGILTPVIDEIIKGSGPANIGNMYDAVYFNAMGADVNDQSDASRWETMQRYADQDRIPILTMLENIIKLPQFAKGGIATSASIFGEAGPEAAVPLPDGRSIPVTINNGSIVDNIVAALSSIFSTNNTTGESPEEETTDKEMLQELSDLRKDIKVLLAAINNSTQEGNKAVIRAISDKFKDNRVLRS